jgi:adenosylcobinamide-GDP ribazoletransferase
MLLGPALLTDLGICLGFFTRLPLALPAGTLVTLTGFSRAVRMLPVAGALLGAFAAAVMAAAAALGLAPLAAAPLAIGALAVFSGAMHEDGLADCADGFFGGQTRMEKLEIMRESRIGSFGAVALVLSFSWRTSSVVLIANQNLCLACAVLTGGAALSRTCALLPLALLPPARKDGAGFSAQKPNQGALVVATLLAVLFALAPVPAGANLTRALVAIALAAGSAFAMVRIAKREIGGQTGDVAGAAQQLAEIAYYLAFAARG